MKNFRFISIFNLTVSRLLRCIMCAVPCCDMILISYKHCSSLGHLEFTLKYLDPTGSLLLPVPVTDLPEVLQSTTVTFQKSFRKDKQDCCLVPNRLPSAKCLPERVSPFLIIPCTLFKTPSDYLDNPCFKIFLQAIFILWVDMVCLENWI